MLHLHNSRLSQVPHHFLDVVDDDDDVDDEDEADDDEEEDADDADEGREDRREDTPITLERVLHGERVPKENVLGQRLLGEGVAEEKDTE